MAGRHRADEIPSRPGMHIPAVPPEDSHPTRRRGPRHAAPDTVRGEPAKKAPAKKAAPKKAAKASSPPARSAGGGGSGGRPRRSGGGAGAAAAGAAAVAHHQASAAAAGGKPTVTGRAVGGGAAGAATGAALGSVVPGVGTAVGAGVGAAVGGVGGAMSGARAKKAWKRAMSMNPVAEKLIVIEFAVCVVIVALSPLTDRRKDEPAGKFMKRMTALMAVFFILGLLSAAGRGGARFSAGLGGLVAVGLAISERDLFTHLANIFKTDTPVSAVGGAVGSGPTDAERQVDVRSMRGRSRGLPGRRTG